MFGVLECYNVDFFYFGEEDIDMIFCLVFYNYYDIKNGKI